MGRRSWALPTWTNRAVFPGGREDPAIKAIEGGLSPEMFAERIGGSPIAHEDQVFRGESIEKCIGPLGQPVGWVTIGLDLGRVRDCTVAITLNSLRQVVEVQRFSRVDCVQQISRVVEIYRRLHAQSITVDSTGLGDPICELLYRHSLTVNPVHMTTEVRDGRGHALGVASEQGVRGDELALS